MRTENERQYLDLIWRVIEDGSIAGSRAGETISLPGQQITVDLRHGFPLLTTRKMFTAGIFGELAAFVRGAEDLATFEKFGCNYWLENARNWWPNHDKPQAQWMIGKSYGSLWRDFGGVDQLSEVIFELKHNPLSRRHVVSAWHPAAEACLPSCHIMFQFYVRDDYLHCHVYMRSVDLCVGLPSDMVLYALLMSLVAKDVGLTPATLTFSFGDCHVYTNHVETFVNEQAPRLISKAPSLQLLEQATTLTFTPEQAVILDYSHAPAIKYTFNS